MEEIAFKYMVVIILPAIFLYCLATYIFTRTSNFIMSKLIGAFILCGAVGYTIEAYRIVTDVAYSHKLQSFFVMPIINLCLALILHMNFNLIQKVKNFKKMKRSILPYGFYIFPVIILAFGILEELVFQQPMYFKGNDWVIREGEIVPKFPAIVAISMLTLQLLMIVIGLKKSVTKQYKIFFTCSLVITMLTLAIFIGWTLGSGQVISLLPPTPGLAFVLILSSAYTYLIVKLDFIPSVVKQHAALMETAPISIIYIDSKMDIINANDIALRKFGLFKGRNFYNYFDFKENPEIFEKLFQEMNKTSTVYGFRLNFYDGFHGECTVSIDASQVKMGDEINYYCMIHDVTAEEQQSKVQQFLAYHDSLTGTFNRGYFEKFVMSSLESSPKEINNALTMIDLNDFKQINDEYGHQIGDLVLIYVAEFLKENMPRPSTLARVGGDEFMVYFENISTEEKFIDTVNEVCTKLQTSPFHHEKIKINIRLSLGVSYTRNDGSNFLTLYKLCDERMYEQKKKIKQEIMNQNE